jgi:PAS domain S-box-containing protein
VHALADDERGIANTATGIAGGAGRAAPSLPPEIAAWRALTTRLKEAFMVGELIRDAHGQAVDWRYVDINAAWETMRGLPREAVLGRRLLDINPQADGAWVARFGARIDANETLRYSGELDTPGRWYEGNAFRLRDDYFCAVYLEATAGRQAADAAQRLTALVEQATDFIGVADADQAMRFINPAGLRLVGLADLPQAATTHLIDFVEPAEGARLWAQIRQAVGETGAWEGDLPFRNFATGEIFAVHCTLLALHDGRGTLTGFGVVGRDLRARQQADARRAALHELGERLGTLDDPDDMTQAASAILMRTLRASRAAYGSVDAAHETITVTRDCAAPGVGSLQGTYRFSDFGSYIDALTRNEIVVFNDTETDPRAVAQAWREVGARAVINLPIFEHGRLVVIVLVHQITPRIWMPQDLAFARHVAERTRAAVERRRAEMRLQELANSLERQVAERTADRNLLWQLSTDIMVVLRFDGTVVSINPAWQHTLGWSEADLVGSTLAYLLHPDDRQRSMEAVAQLVEGQAVGRFDNRYRHRNGSYRTISWTGVLGEGVISAVGRDVTEERARAAALELSEGRMRSVFETSYGYQGLLSPQGIVLDANPASLEGIAARLEDIAGKPFWETAFFTGTEGLPALIQAAIPVVASGQPVRREITSDMPTGRRTFDMSMRPVFNAAGAVIAIVPEAMEVTEQRAAEAQLRQSQKMEAVGQLTGGLAHDFNNLMTGITGNLELLLSRVQQGKISNLNEYIEAAQSAARRAAALTHRLLAFSRQQTLDPKPTDINQLVLGMAEMIRRAMGPDVTTEVIGAPGLWRTLIDQNQLENALLNLCINARQAMPRGGRLTIETRNNELDAAAARKRDLPPGPYVTLCVTDTGTGMTPEVMARAFDPFFTTKPLGEGTGLGLSMIYGFVRQSGGQARIQSTPGQGSSLSLYFPRHEGADEAAPAQGEQAGEAHRARPGQSVLIVDDEPTIRMLIVEVLEDLGYETMDAADGAAGLAILRSPRRLDLLISDVGLPGGMNGREMADLARELRPELPVLFITGYAEHAVLGHGHLRPGMRVLTKPFTIEALAQKIRDALEGRR